MKARFPGGVWPTMITPYAADMSIDWNCLKELVEWYIEKGVSGLFSVCQSSEMFYLSLEERLQLAQRVVEYGGKRLPVIASGNVSDTIEKQIEEINLMAQTGVDAVILISNRLASHEESDTVFIKKLDCLLNHVSSSLPLGFYECPYPYKRLLSPEILKYCVNTGRFYFLKDTSCDLKNIKQKLSIMEGTGFQLYNANSATLLPSLQAGAAGYSGVMANFHPELYVWLLTHWKAQPDRASFLSDFLSMASFIEKEHYPVCAKYYLRLGGLPIQPYSRNMDSQNFSDTHHLELKQLERLSGFFSNKCLKGGVV